VAITILVPAVFLVDGLAAQNSTAKQLPHAANTGADRNGYVGNEACARCHAAIYASYQRTAMALASGRAVDALTPAPAQFTHKASGVHYRIYGEAGRAWLSFDRPGDPEVRGKRELLYFIGSGRRGRTFLFETDGFLFESPVNWYANKQMWDTAPAYQSSREMPLNLPAYASCLHCHVSGMQAPLKGTENRYPDPAFTQNGVSCERCHGPGAVHAGGGAIVNAASVDPAINPAIVNPAKLPAARRDEVCMQCHLEGKVAIERAGHHVYEYRPGENLTDYIRYFVLAGSQESSSGTASLGTASLDTASLGTASLGAVSQVEALAQSQCKKKSGDAMSCTSCHDPHQSPPAQEAAAYYRTKCLACHGAAFANKHHSDHPDCIGCHMPAALSSDVAHTEVTDHRIPRRPQTSPQLLQDPASASSLPRLVRFPAADKDDSDGRDLALAWASLAEGGMTEAEPQARDRLARSTSQSPVDPALLSSLGYIEQKRGAAERARHLYQEALAIDPDLIDAETNLGVIEAQGGEMKEAVRLWLSAFQNAPYRSGIGLNLARAFCADGKTGEARTYTLRVLEFNPDLAAAKQMLRHLSSVPASCGP
jgi:predicted CXXCH cytochrome family protein